MQRLSNLLEIWCFFSSQILQRATIFILNPILHCGKIESLLRSVVTKSSWFASKLTRPRAHFRKVGREGTLETQFARRGGEQNTRYDSANNIQVTRKFNLLAVGVIGRRDRVFRADISIKCVNGGDSRRRSSTLASRTHIIADEIIGSSRFLALLVLETYSLNSIFRDKSY